MFETDALGDVWPTLVNAWIRFEESSVGLTGTRGSLPAKGRPSGVYDWIQRARNPNFRPEIADSKAFGDKHIAWWTSLQPEWRISDDGDIIRNYDDYDGGDFEGLRKPGVNGLLSALASLYFWGMAVKDSGKKSKRWVQSVEDCVFVLSCLSPAA